MSPDNERCLRLNHPQLLARPEGKAAMVRFADDGFAVADGWLAILDDMAAEIEQVCAMTGSKLPAVLQIQEKFGLLRVYVSGADDAVRAIIVRSEERSACICEACGAPGSLRRRTGWVRTRCEVHASRHCR